MKKTEFYKSHNRKVLTILSRKTIGIIGVGGIGSNVVVSLARSGVGKLIMADFDTIKADNLNRQYYFINQIGMKKIDAIKENLIHINPFIQYEFYNKKIDKKSINLFENVDILIEAIDDASQKAEILTSWQSKYDKPIILCSGIAGIGSNEEIHCRKIDELTYICGDEKTSINDFEPYAPKVAIVANFMANLTLELLLNTEVK